MAATEIYTNNATTTVSNGGTTASSGTQMWTVASSALFPSASTVSSTQFHVGDPAAPSELIAVINVSSSTWTVTRGAESTSPVAHAQGFTVASVITAGGLNGLLSGASGPLSVTSGGSGGTAVTAYAVVTGGTSATTPLQTVASLGSSGQLLTSQGAGALPTWQATPAGGTATAGILQLDGTSADIQAAGVGSAGSGTLAAISTHVHPNKSYQSFYICPSAATAETFPRWAATANTTAGNSGALYVVAIGLPAGIAINNITLSVGTTVAAGVTHGWYTLLDSGLVVRAISTDQGVSTLWGTASTLVTLSVAAASYTTTYSGLYYAGVMIAMSGGTMPTLVATSAVQANIYSAAPVYSGVSSSGLGTAPSIGTTMQALTGQGNRNFYAYTS